VCALDLPFLTILGSARPAFDHAAGYPYTRAREAGDDHGIQTGGAFARCP
jgi:hypothetical protein